MARFLAYIEPVAGRLYPLVPTLVELTRRGHHVSVRTGSEQAPLLQSIGIEADILAPDLAGFQPQDWRARTRFGALIAALNQFGGRAMSQRADLRTRLPPTGQTS